MNKFDSEIVFIKSEQTFCIKERIKPLVYFHNLSSSSPSFEAKHNKVALNTAHFIPVEENDLSVLKHINSQ